MDAALDNVGTRLSVEGCQGIVQNAKCTLLVRARFSPGRVDVVKVVGDACTVAVARCVAVSVAVVVDDAALEVVVAAAAVVVGVIVQHGWVGSTTQRAVGAPAFGKKRRQHQPPYRFRYRLQLAGGVHEGISR